MSEPMVPYVNLVKEIRAVGRPRGDRTGTGTYAIFGRQLHFNLAEYFPLLSLKYTGIRDIVAELVWLLSGSSDNNLLNALGCKIWNKWAVKEEHLKGKELTRQERIMLLTSHIARSGVNAQEILQDESRTEAAFLTFNIPTHAKDHPPEWLGQLGPIYGSQWRKWDEIYWDHENKCYLDRSHDQITTVIKSLKENPYSRRHIVSAWNVADLPDEKVKPWDNVLDYKMSLAPCHVLFQFFVEDMTYDEIRARNPQIPSDYWGEFNSLNEKHKEQYIADLNDSFPPEKAIKTKRLSCQLFMRSIDFVIGGPYNIASYSLMTHLMANECGYDVGEFILTTGDTHIYQNQIEGVDKMLDRIGKWDDEITLPKLDLGNRKLSDYLGPTPTAEMVDDLAGCLSNYNPQPFIMIPVAT